MSDRLCARCQNAVPPGDGSLTYCPHCGAAQVFLPSELREQAADQARRFAEAQAPPPGEPVTDSSQAASGGQIQPRRTYAGPPGGVIWPVAVRSAALVGLGAIGFGLGSLLIAPVVLPALMWALLAPLAALHLYRSRAPETYITPEFGARLGLMSALFVALGTVLVYTSALVLKRFAFHGAGPIDAMMESLFTQTKAQAAQMLQAQGAAVIAQVSAIYDIPEFRVGVLISFASLFGGIYLLVTSLIGALAGQMRSSAVARR